MSQRFTPYGTLLARVSSMAVPAGLRFGWTGREPDAETGLYYFRARYYDPGQRRFTQEDPIGYGGGANVYGYVDGAGDGGAGFERVAEGQRVLRWKSA